MKRLEDAATERLNAANMVLRHYCQWAEARQRGIDVTVDDLMADLLDLHNGIMSGAHHLSAAVGAAPRET